MPQSDLDELTGRTSDGVSRTARYLATFDAIISAARLGDHERERLDWAALKSLWEEMTESDRWEISRPMVGKFGEQSAAYATAAIPRDDRWSVRHAEDAPNNDVRRLVRLSESVAAAFANYVGGSGFDAKQLAAEMPRLIEDHVHLKALKRAGLGVDEIRRLEAENDKLREEVAKMRASEDSEAAATETSDGPRRAQHRRDRAQSEWQARPIASAAAASDLRSARPYGETQETISQWAEATFGPAGSNARAVARANREMSELFEHVTSDDKHPEAAEEIADIVIVLYRVATRLGVDLHQKIDAKMARNRVRKWKLDGTGHGYHVKETESR